MLRVAVIFWLCAVSAMASSDPGAPQRVSLIALSAHGTHAVLTYGQDWVEVSLESGAATKLVAPVGCSWASVAYAPVGDEMAMTAFCPAQEAACREAQSLMVIAGADRGRYRLAAETSGARWSRLYWRGGAQDVLAIEIPLTTPVATNLDDLGKPSDGCEAGAARLISVGTDTGRRIRHDIAPRDWRYKKIVAASAHEMIAEIRMQQNGPSEISAAARLDEICAAAPRSPLCRPNGVAVELVWRDGDWRFASPPEDARRGRLVANAALNVIGRERCEARWVEERFRPVCVIAFEHVGGVTSEISAPAGLFGDLALSPDGEWLLAVASGIGRRLKQFDLFNTTTGERRSFPDLLTLTPPYDTSERPSR